MVRTQQRPGFTLLEVMLALAIGVVMLGALYYAVDAQLKLAQTAATWSKRARSLAIC